MEFASAGSWLDRFGRARQTLVLHLWAFLYKGSKGKILKRLLAILACATPVFAQYAGPAILSRGDAPSAMEAPQISFRPFLEVTGIYNTGLAGVGVNSQGALGNTASAGVDFGGGISGVHSWRHTMISVDYRGEFREYTKATYFDSSNQSMKLQLKHQFTRHVTLELRENAGSFSQAYGLVGLSPAVPFDPSTTNVPTTDFFDNRTIYANTGAELIFQKTARLSFDFGGDGFITSRRSAALASVVGASAHADVQYRLTRRTTIGGNYNFTEFSYSGVLSNTNLHGLAATYAIQLTRHLEFTGYGGAMRVETKFVQDVPVDPVIAALIGLTESTRIDYSVRYVPNINARLSNTFKTGVLYVGGGHTVTPGNGLFLTSIMTTVTGGYSYTGLRSWSFNAHGAYDNADSIGNVSGKYRDESGGFSASRQIARAFHAVASFDARKYSSPNFALYNRVVYESKIGVGWTPGDVPLRIW